LYYINYYKYNDVNFFVKAFLRNFLRNFLSYRRFSAPSRSRLRFKLGGAFLRIISEAAEEDRQNGKKRITPYWRVIKADGSLNPKFPGGVKAQAARLKEEGHKIIPDKGKRPPKVRDYGKSLA